MALSVASIARASRRLGRNRSIFRRSLYLLGFLCVVELLLFLFFLVFFSNGNIAELPPSCSPDGWAITNSDSEIRFAIDFSLEYVNAFRRGFEQLKVFGDYPSNLAFRQVDSCFRDYDLSGVELTFYRNLAMPNEVRRAQSVVRVPLFAVEACRELRLFSEYSVTVDKPVYLVVTGKERPLLVRQFFDNLLRVWGAGERSFVVVYYSFDQDYSNVYQSDWPFPIVTMGSPGFFSRSIGLFHGVSMAANDSLSRFGNRNPLIFVIDLSVRFDKDLFRQIRGFTIPNRMVYAPIINKNQSEADAVWFGDPNTGFWNHPGYGMVSFFFDDYVAAGQYDTSYGQNWGREDVDLLNRISFEVTRLWIFRDRPSKYFYVGESSRHSRVQNRWERKRGMLGDSGAHLFLGDGTARNGVSELDSGFFSKSEVAGALSGYRMYGVAEPDYHNYSLLYIFLFLEEGRLVTVISKSSRFPMIQDDSVFRTESSERFRPMIRR